jgi:hypothetical protein
MVKIGIETSLVVFTSFTLLCSRLVIHLFFFLIVPLLPPRIVSHLDIKAMSGKSWNREVEESAVIISSSLCCGLYNNPECLNDSDT